MGAQLGFRPRTPCWIDGQRHLDERRPAKAEVVVGQQVSARQLVKDYDIEYELYCIAFFMGIVLNMVIDCGLH